MPKKRFISIVAACSLWFELGLLFASDAITGNSFLLQANGQIKLGANDPYFVLNTPEYESERYLLVPLQFAETAEDNQPSLQVFYRPLNKGFDPRYRITYRLTDVVNRQQAYISLPLPPETDFSMATTIRLDIEGCAQCTIELSPAIKFSKEPIGLEAELTSVRNGIRVLDDASMDLGEWRYNHTNQDGIIDGIDPFAISPLLDLDTSTLGGVLIELEADLDPRFAQFQLFYATEQHGFVERSSVFFEIGIQPPQHKLVFIPLGHLHSDSPPQMVLERLRLDINTSSGRWMIKHAQLISASAVAPYKNLIPERMFFKKHQRARGMNLVRKIIQKILSDAYFVFAYAVLLLLTFLGFRLTFQRHS